MIQNLRSRTVLSENNRYIQSRTGSKDERNKGKLSCLFGRRTRKNRPPVLWETVFLFKNEVKGGLLPYYRLPRSSVKYFVLSSMIVLMPTFSNSDIYLS